MCFFAECLLYKSFLHLRILLSQSQNQQFKHLSVFNSLVPVQIETAAHGCVLLAKLVQLFLHWAKSFRTSISSSHHHHPM